MFNMNGNSNNTYKGSPVQFPAKAPQFAVSLTT